MVCNKCNAQVQEGTQFCPNCGNNLSANSGDISVANGVNQQQVQNFEQSLGNAQVNNVSQSVNNQDKVNVWLVILSWFIPLAGLIIFFVKKNSSPKTAKASGICALISAVLSLVVVGLCFSLIFGVMNNAIEQNDGLVEEIIDEAESQIEDIEDDMDSIVTTDDNSNTVPDNSNTSTTTSSTAVSKDWKQYQVGIGGKVYTIPMTYPELKTASGFSLKDSETSLVLPNNYYGLANLYKNNKLALYVELYNNSGSEAKYVDSKVTRISQTKYQVSQGAEAVVFPGEIKVGDAITDAQITGLFGTPNDIKDYGTSKQYSYYSDTTWTTTNNYIIKVVNGVIDEIQLDNRG